jgi:hydrogenase expression/formation protein HypE
MLMDDYPMNKTANVKLNMKTGIINLSHGSGGRAMTQLIEQLFLKEFDNNIINQQHDSAHIPVAAGRLAMATDSHVVSPLFFPGGDIGSLSVHGTVNDIAMSGAMPHYMAVSFIIEEGFPLSQLQCIVSSMGRAAREANVVIVTGDTKVVERGKGDGVFITTTGIGVIPPQVHIGAHRVQAGDKILLSGFIGDHGVAVMSQRENLQFDVDLHSDTASLHTLVQHMLEAVPDIHCLRDPTRGGLSAALNEIAEQAGVGMVIDEKTIPVKDAVVSACELLGLDALHVANEGKLVAICAADDAQDLLKAMKAHALGHDAVIIGEVIVDENHFVQLRTVFGGKRMIDWLHGEQLPRIC